MKTWRMLHIQRQYQNERSIPGAAKAIEEPVAIAQNLRPYQSSEEVRR